MLFARERSIVIRSIHSWNHDPFPPPLPSFPSFCFDARTLIGVGRSAIQTEQIIRVSLVRMSGANRSNRYKSKSRARMEGKNLIRS